ncbi:MAG: 16S rRNA (uracil(1498)-N(3))-methyltransferase [Candidatus Margulisiibacteriota bacterium]
MRWFANSRDIQGDTLALSKDEAHYLSNVVRVKPHDRVGMVVDQAELWEIQVSVLHKKGLVFELLNRQPILKSTSPTLMLAQALPKQDKFSEILRSCTELGVSTFIPLQTDRTQGPDVAAVDKKKPRWEAVLQSAAEQSKRLVQPELQPLKTIEALKAVEAELKIVFWEEATDPLKQVLSNTALKTTDRILAVIGPEGGLSVTDIEALQSQGFKVASLGQSILRVEHAGVVALGQLLYAYQ